MDENIDFKKIWNGLSETSEKLNQIYKEGVFFAFIKKESSNKVISILDKKIIRFHSDYNWSKYEVFPILREKIPENSEIDYFEKMNYQIALIKLITKKSWEIIINILEDKI